MASPKQPQAESRRDWYPYYAGYRTAFVVHALETHLGLASGPILDPWNGSGTTTAACAAMGIPSTGLDINPAMTVIARARLAAAVESCQLNVLGEEIARTAPGTPPGLVEEDPLSAWLKRGAVSRLRSLERAIAVVLDYDGLSDRGPRQLAAVDSMPITVSFFYCALFVTVRDLLARYRSSNPTWLKTPRSRRHRSDPGWRMIKSVFLERVGFLSERLVPLGLRVNSPRPIIQTGSAELLGFVDGHFAGVLSSPPYATRIDYVVNSLPELAVLGASSELVELLRKVSTGSPVLGDTAPDHLLSSTASALLDQIAKHPTKGSRSYYAPWMRRYLQSLQSALIEIARVVRPGGPIGLVLQDSHYKELQVNLQLMVVEIMDALGRQVEERVDYPLRHHRVAMNPRSRAHLQERKNTESLLVFR